MSKKTDISWSAIVGLDSHPTHDGAPAWRGAGFAIPLFSLRSNESMGVGDFADLKGAVDWAVATNQKMIQILPINDTTMTHTWEDSYPYNANSIFALHPQYLSIKSAGSLKDKAMQREIEREGAELNKLDMIDYERVNALKSRYTRQLYAEIGAETLDTKEFKKFFKESKHWIEAYALFSLLRDMYNTPESEKWGDDAIYSEKLRRKFCTAKSRYYNEIAYYYFVQYLLHCQLVEAHTYAQSRGVIFKGDIPIGVSRTSVDVWVSPELFRLDSQAGAPPDDFSVLGQNWGFPTYNWEEMAKDGYAWWIARFQNMAIYFDAYRIDHILGFFRIWEIPLDAVHGLLGYFNPAMPYTPDQMREWYGFYFEESYARPAINDWTLNQLFGDEANAVRERFFEADQYDQSNYHFKEEYNTQVKVVAATEKGAMQDGLLRLFTELLFIEDPHKRGQYHPRISAQQSYKYQAMNDHDKSCYNALYNDFFYHRHNDFWHYEAMRKLPTLISATSMLTCGEDLGMIPDCVASVMDTEKILSLEIQRMPKNPALEFGEPWNYPYRSVCTTSTHDMNPLRAWLKEDAGTTNRYLQRMFGRDLYNEPDYSGEICELIVKQHLYSPAMWCVLPLQDWLSIDETMRNSDPEAERINVPSNSRHYWRYRMHCTIEELLAAKELNDHIRGIIGESSR